jgi:GNAT superfamily N-acetyltransferase
VPELVFRDAVVEDAAEVRALVVRAYRGESSRAGWTTEADLLADERIDIAEVAAKIAAPDGIVLLAYADDDLIACCELLHKGEGVGYFGMFAVEPTRQAGGIGRRVLAEAERTAAQTWGVTLLEMTVIGQRDELIQWYERRGYVRTEETRPFPFDGLVNGEALRDDLYFAVLAKKLV